ncbi:putative aaa family [Erysiphe neolycopersici]|uniref:Putative aaa family n=1 Tax=Erysiphe neolycopersici TaxID=212602 RepID=A0A420I4B5_9PEZI|nr:putative aaa family [Erysiphe neolycopersici]
MDTPDSKESREATDRQEGVASAEESKSLATTIRLKPKNCPSTENTKSKSRSSKKNQKYNVKKSKNSVISSSDNSDSSVELSSDSSDTSDSSDDSEDEVKKRKTRSGYVSKKKLNEKKKSKKDKTGNGEISDIDSKSSLSELQKEFLRVQIQTQKQRLQRSQRLIQEQNCWSCDGNTNFQSTDAAQLANLLCHPTISKQGDEEVKKKLKKHDFGSKVEYKRIDHWYDKDIHRYRVTDSNENNEMFKYDRYVFNVRKSFDWDGRYVETKVEVKSKYMKEILTKVMEADKSSSFASRSPKVCPNRLFLFRDEIQEYYQNLKSLKKGGKKLSKKSLKHTEAKLKHLKLLIKYLETDYDRVKKTMFPMLESGVINYDLLWGLYKPGSIVCTPTYGSRDYLRAFKVDNYEKVICMKLGPYYLITGKYLEYDGKTWGKGSIEVRVPGFKDVRKITDLECFPLQCHEDAEKIRNDLINRGKKFVSLQGVHYKVHEGMAYLQKKKDIAKVNVTSRIMIDPALHRRYFPNYPISSVMSNYSPNLFGYDSETKEIESDDFEDKVDQEDEDEDCSGNDCKPKTKDRSFRVVTTAEGIKIIPEKTASRDIEVDGNNKTTEIPTFTDEEYIIASPVVLGFSFNDKMWLEFTVSGVKEIAWNENAFESLVLKEDTKSILKALVQSQKSNSTKNIDDVIRGKGKGLVAVLHGPPGTGKTLTAESIAELLKYPLYTVSAGDLGHDSTHLERQLQTILDMAYSWGAVLLLDEADVFLEKRNIADIHRNALVSIFLRLLEYFQGILFLTTNRVETFDEAFRSRIHIALRYQELSSKARQSVFKIFLDRATALEGVDVGLFTEKDLNELSKHSLNGRQIKNTVRTALALAVQNNETLNMSHVQRVLNMSKEFERHLQGGTGFEDAMRGYF